MRRWEPEVQTCLGAAGPPGAKPGPSSLVWGISSAPLALLATPMGLLSVPPPAQRSKSWKGRRGAEAGESLAAQALQLAAQETAIYHLG